MHNILAKNIGSYVVIVQREVCIFCLVVHGLNASKFLLGLNHRLFQCNSKILLPLLMRQVKNIKKKRHLKLWQKVAPLPQCLRQWKSKTQNLVSRLFKHIATANLVLGPEFLEEVQIYHLTLWTLNVICSILLSAHIPIDWTDSEALEYKFHPRDDLGEIANDCHCKCGSNYQVSLAQAMELKFL